MDNQVAEIKSKIDIVSIIGERIDLKKAGRNYKANCPFHGEKTPSFMVSPELQIFKCFGCSESGDAFSFLEKYEGMDFPEALKYLADKIGIKLQNYLLLEHPVGKKALEYLVHDRGLKPDTIKEFQLGFSPENSYSLKKFLIDKKKFLPSDIERAGIGLIRGSNIYDRFNGRITFPLFDHRGNPIGFAGRILPWDKRETGKYINSPETPLYHKSSVLYALNLTRGWIKKKKVAIIVEGELDAISSYQAGIKNVVAIKGSALTEEQIRLLSRFAPKFILALDADMAGDAASRRGLTIAGNAGIEVKIAKLSNFKDPDEAARHDLAGYKKDLIEAEGSWDYLINSVFSRFNSSTGSGKAKISKELIPILSEIGDRIVQAHYANVIARRLDVPLMAVTDEVDKNKKAVALPKILTESEIGSDKDRKVLLEERLLAMGFQTDPKIFLSESVSKLISTPLNIRILEEYMKFSSLNKDFDLSVFASSLSKELFDGFAQMVLGGNEEEFFDPDLFKKEFDLVQKELKIFSIKDNLKFLASEMRNLEKDGDKDKLFKVQNEFGKLAEQLSGYTEADGGGIILKEP